MSIQGQWGRRREGNQFFQRSAGNSSCLTNSLDPRWANLYALSSLLVSDSESVSKPIIMFVSDIIDLCVRARIRAFESVCLNGKPPGVHFFSDSPTVQHHTRIVHSRVSLGNAAFLSNVFCAACSSRGLIMLGLKAQTPPCQRLYKSHTVISGKICFFSYSFEGWQYNIKPWQIKAINYLLSLG